MRKLMALGLTVAMAVCASPLLAQCSSCSQGIAPSYGTPVYSGSVAMPMQSYAAPMQSYSAPMQSYAAPMQSYAAPVQSYSAPMQSYSAPVQNYSAPMVTSAPMTYSAPMATSAPMSYGTPMMNSNSGCCCCGSAGVMNSAPVYSQGAVMGGAIMGGTIVDGGAVGGTVVGGETIISDVAAPAADGSTVAPQATGEIVEPVGDSNTDSTTPPEPDDAGGAGESTPGEGSDT